MLIERRFGIASGYVMVDWQVPVKSMVLLPNEAHFLADLFGKVAQHADEGRPSPNEGSPEIRMAACGRYAAIHWGQHKVVWLFTRSEAARLASALREVAYKAERNERGLLPTVKEIDRMEEALVGKHTIIQDTSRVHDVGPPGIQIRPQGSFLSRLIRKSWW